MLRMRDIGWKQKRAEGSTARIVSMPSRTPDMKHSSRNLCHATKRPADSSGDLNAAAASKEPYEVRHALSIAAASPFHVFERNAANAPRAAGDLSW